MNIKNDFYNTLPKIQNPGNENLKTVNGEMFPETLYRGKGVIFQN